MVDWSWVVSRGSDRGKGSSVRFAEVRRLESWRVCRFDCMKWQNAQSCPCNLSVALVLNWKKGEKNFPYLLGKSGGFVGGSGVVLMCFCA